MASSIILAGRLHGLQCSKVGESEHVRVVDANQNTVTIHHGQRRTQTGNCIIELELISHFGAGACSVYTYRRIHELIAFLFKLFSNYSKFERRLVLGSPSESLIDKIKPTCEWMASEHVSNLVRLVVVSNEITKSAFVSYKNSITNSYVRVAANGCSIVCSFERSTNVIRVSCDACDCRFEQAAHGACVFETAVKGTVHKWHDADVLVYGWVSLIFRHLRRKQTR